MWLCSCEIFHPKRIQEILFSLKKFYFFTDNRKQLGKFEFKIRNKFTYSQAFSPPSLSLSSLSLSLSFSSLSLFSPLSFPFSFGKPSVMLSRSSKKCEVRKPHSFGFLYQEVAKNHLGGKNSHSTVMYTS